MDVTRSDILDIALALIIIMCIGVLVTDDGQALIKDIRNKVTLTSSPVPNPSPGLSVDHVPDITPTTRAP